MQNIYSMHVIVEQAHMLWQSFSIKNLSEMWLHGTQNLIVDIIDDPGNSCITVHACLMAKDFQEDLMSNSVILTHNLGVS